MRRTVSKAKETVLYIAKKWQVFHRQIFLTCHVPYDTLKLYIYSLR